MSLLTMTIHVAKDGFCKIDKIRYPTIGFGTYPLKGQKCFEVVDKAAALGYRIIDTATFYGNFHPIGEALKKHGRHHFYLISKVWPDSQTPQKLEADLKMTLSQLQTEYLDAYLLHWPNSKVPIEKTLQAMERMRENKLIRHLGMSNITVAHLRRASEVQIPLHWVQVEMNPFFYDENLLDYCFEKSIAVQAWAPLARDRVTYDPLLKQIGEKYKKSAAQIALRWIVQHECIALPGSSDEKHLQENKEVTNFTLLPQEMDAIDHRAKMGKRERIMDGNLGFTDEFDFSYDNCWPKKK